MQGLQWDAMHAIVQTYSKQMGSIRHLLSDLTLPLISVFSGHGFDHVVRESFVQAPSTLRTSGSGKQPNHLQCVPHTLVLVKGVIESISVLSTWHTLAAWQDARRQSLCHVHPAYVSMLIAAGWHAASSA